MNTINNEQKYPIENTTTNKIDYMNNKINVVVWRDYGDCYPKYPNQTILHGICGRITLEDVIEIQKMFNDLEVFEMPQDEPKTWIGVECSVYWDTGETQEGRAPGHVMGFPGYWYYNITGYILRSDDDVMSHVTCKDFVIWTRGQERRIAECNVEEIEGMK